MTVKLIKGDTLEFSTCGFEHIDLSPRTRINGTPKQKWQKLRRILRNIELVGAAFSRESIL
jgi:hypothetical protein